MLQIEEQFAHFQVQEHMAQGGMSDIYLAYDKVNCRQVVLKIPELSMISDPAHYERFQREMEVVTGLNHPAVLHGLETGQYDRTPYLVTELVKGISLRQVIATLAPMPEERAIDLVYKIAVGMAYCHANGVIHRDLKPENILVTGDGQPVIMDFGLALTKGAQWVPYSNLSTTMGTPDYMAPEQIEGERGDARTDIYALGTLFFEMLSGRLPFSGDNNSAIMAQHIHGTAPRLDRVQPGVSASIAAIVAGCMQPIPDDRYQTMESLAEALEHPESVDLAILEITSDSSSAKAWWQSMAVRAVAISALVLMAIIAIVVVLQNIRP